MNADSLPQKGAEGTKQISSLAPNGGGTTIREAEGENEGNHLVAGLGSHWAGVRGCRPFKLPASHPAPGPATLPPLGRR